MLYKIFKLCLTSFWSLGLIGLTLILCYSPPYWLRYILNQLTRNRSGVEKRLHVVIFKFAYGLPINLFFLQKFLKLSIFLFYYLFQDYPDIPSQHDSLPEFFNFANNSANAGKDPRSSPAHNKRHSCPPIPFQRKFSPVRNSSPQTKVHSPALPPIHHRGSPYHNHQGKVTSSKRLGANSVKLGKK